MITHDNCKSEDELDLHIFLIVSVRLRVSSSKKSSQITMWKLTQDFPILQEKLPFPRDGVLAGFGCPICYKTCRTKNPCVYRKSDYTHLIGLTCRAFDHYFRTPKIKDVIEEVSKHNQQAQHPSQFGHLPISEPSSVTESTSKATKSDLECHGINGRFASGHRKQCLKRCPNKMCQQVDLISVADIQLECCRSSDITCSDHRYVKDTPSTSAAPVERQSQSRAEDPFNSALQQGSNRVNPQADRQAIKDLPREAIAHHNNARLRTQAAKDRGDDLELTLCVWLQAGEATEILATASNFPRYALNESRSLGRLAEKILGPSWDLELEKLIDAHQPVPPPSDTKKLLIRAFGLPPESCVGIDDSITSLKSKILPTTVDIHDLLQPTAPKGIWATSRVTTDDMQATSSNDIELESGSEIEFVGTSKRKNPAGADKDIESSPLAKKKPRKLLPFPGLTCKLSELMVWCSKAPGGSGSAKGVAKETWYELFGDRYEPDFGLKTPY
ncbi:uncharacterized protein MELLADRAFT_61009 [Melampsora larici-populina 98AG31]|uniref:Uncharacterized protein n=1 Tax=Melampsora larici-populina (strain 98AG31 / pathotype 3-4-7) TaxID=747676 RepID=F4RD90_MELLP|nr:uncharacterized protein MELLADRAFT_61009 [Melampsora larici-populina 98AG31]EGG09652.1 hypothetical protein MELLADRAFT_61009 [Melampsora larici-populina 98AG31]